MKDIQYMFDTLSKWWRAERSVSQMTLWGLIDALLDLPKDKLIENIGSPHSYRWYYSDLSLERMEWTRTVWELLSDLNSALWKTYQGWKWWDFYMDTHTPLWIAEEWCTWVKIMDIIDWDTISFATQEDD